MKLFREWCFISEKCRHLITLQCLVKWKEVTSRIYYYRRNTDHTASLMKIKKKLVYKRLFPKAIIRSKTIWICFASEFVLRQLSEKNRGLLSSTIGVQQFVVFEPRAHGKFRYFLRLFHPYLQETC